MVIIYIIIFILKNHDLIYWYYFTRQISFSMYMAGESRSIVKLVPAAGDTYKLANQVLIPLRFTPISPHPAANTLIRPLILQDKSFRSSYSPPFCRRNGQSYRSERITNDSDSPRSLLISEISDR